MKKIFLRIGIALAAIIALLLLVASTKPDIFWVERSLMINASAEKIFPHIMNFHQWLEWSPWEKMEPQMKRTYNSVASGIGAAYEWQGETVGSGRMEILDMSALNITIKLDFTAPFEAHNTAEFNFEPGKNSTKVTWVMYGKNNLLGKVMHIFFDMDSTVGKDFETGLANLKILAEK